MDDEEKFHPEEEGDSNGSGRLDPFDPASYKKVPDPLSEDSVFSNGLPSTLRVGKPHNDWYIRLHPHPDYRLRAKTFVDRDSKSRDCYLFAPDFEIPEEIDDLVRETLIVPAVARNGIYFLYTLNINESSWYATGKEVVRRGVKEWVRVKCDGEGYEVKNPQSKFPEPVFPDVPLREYLVRAFSKRLVRDANHPLVKRLLGIVE